MGTLAERRAIPTQHQRDYPPPAGHNNTQPRPMLSTSGPNITTGATPPRISPATSTGTSGSETLPSTSPPHPPQPSASSSSATSEDETAAMEVATTSIATPKGPAGGYRSARSQAPRALQPEGVGDPAALSATRHKARQRLARSSGAPRCTVRTAPVVGYGQYPHCSRYGGGSDAGASRPVMSHDRPH